MNMNERGQAAKNAYKQNFSKAEKQKSGKECNACDPVSAVETSRARSNLSFVTLRSKSGGSGGGGGSGSE